MRPVTGVVRDAETQRPIAGAWIAWRLPPPGLVDRVLGDPEYQRAGVGLLSDARGGFRIPRLPDDLEPSATLFVVAPGYAYRSLDVGLAREVAVDLVRMGTLEVAVAGARTAAVTVHSAEHAAIADALPAWGQEPGVYTITHLPPGSYSVALGGEQEVEAEVVAGRVSRVELVSSLQRASGTLLRSGHPVAKSPLSFVHTRTYVRVQASTDAFGRFEATLPRGPHAVFAELEGSERRVGALAAPAAGVVLQCDPAQLGEIQVQLPSHTRSRPEELGLVRTDVPLSSLIALEPGDGPGWFTCNAEPGRYALFEGVRFWGIHELSGVTSIRAAEGGRRLIVKLDLSGLAPGDYVRCRLALVPLAVTSARPDLDARLAEGLAQTFLVGSSEPSLTLSVGAPGAYRLVGDSDLGRIHERVDVRGDRTTVDLPGIPEPGR